MEEFKVKHKLYFIIVSVLLCISPAAVHGEEAPLTPEPDAMPLIEQMQEAMPLDIITNEDKTEIRKIYDLDPALADDCIPKGAFDLNGFHYTYFDTLQSDVEVTTSKLYDENVTLSASSNDTATVMSLLAKTKEITTDDGFSGTLFLDNNSIKTEVSGYGTNSYTVTATRSYPNLSDADMQYIPKTIEDNGTTMTFQDVQWEEDTSMNVDDYEIGVRYTANVTYSGTASETYVKGYTIIATYSGEVSRTDLSKKRYTVIFSGAPIPVEPVEEKPFLPAWTKWGIPLGLVLLICAGTGTAALIKKRSRKETENEEDSHFNNDDDAFDDDDDPVVRS